MSSSRLLLVAAGLLALRGGALAQRVGEAVVAPAAGSGAGAVSAAPSAAPIAAPTVLAAPPAALAPAALAPAALAPAPIAPAALPALPAAALAAAGPMESLRIAGARLDAAAKPGAEARAGAALDALFEGSAAAGAETAVIDGRVAALAARLGKPAPGSAGRRRMPAGVRAAFSKSVVMGGGMAALFAGLWPAIHALAPSATLPQFALVALPLALLPLHFALVSGFWAGRYYLYPRLGGAGKTAFRGAWSAAAAVYPAAALTALGAWAAFLSRSPSLLLLFSPVALLAAGEVVHHFAYRLTSERRQDDGKPLRDWRSRAWGNVGQQLRRMGRR